MATIIDQARWGVCGFVSVLNGLRSDGLLLKSSDGNELPLVDIQSRLYAEILSYMKYLRFINSSLIAEIEGITEICRPKTETKKSFDDIISVIEKWVTTFSSFSGDGTSLAAKAALASLIKYSNLTIAMSPNSIVDYIKWSGEKGTQYAMVNPINCTSDNLILFNGCIIGLGGVPMNASNYNGLQHWVYVDRDGTLDNWGKKTKLNAGTLGTSIFGEWATHVTHIIKLR